MAKRSKTLSFIAERRIYTSDPNHDPFIDSKMDLGNRIYNNGVRHFKEVLPELYADTWYQYSLAQYQKAEKKFRRIERMEKRNIRMHGWLWVD